VTAPQLIERFINWNGEVKTILIPCKLRRLTKILIIGWQNANPTTSPITNTEAVKNNLFLTSIR
jgi:hypothetical protein